MYDSKKKEIPGLSKGKFLIVWQVFLVLFLFFILGFGSVFAVPDGADSIGIIANETSTTAVGENINISGGRIATINITASTQNPRWKAFVGNVSGSFSLDDSSGSTIYDWSLTSVSGEIYATTNGSTIAWSTIQCANASLLENENGIMSHTNAEDNITLTFNNGLNGTHAEFFVGQTNITLNTCPTLNTYVSNSSQDTSFEEMVITDSVEPTLANGNVIYATIMEDDVAGFDTLTYDFQMIVPEVGTDGFSGSTAYYLYVELT